MDKQRAGHKAGGCSITHQQEECLCWASGATLSSNSFTDAVQSLCCVFNLLPAVPCVPFPPLFLQDRKILNEAMAIVEP